MKINRDLLYILVIVLLLATCGQLYFTKYYQPTQSREVKIYYNQDHQLNSEVIQTIQHANKFIYFAIYTFTREDIKDALLGAKYRGVEIKGIIDKKQSESLPDQKAIVQELRNAGIQIVFNDHSYIMHLKTLVTDAGYVSGSYNWTASGTDLNDEILEVGNDEDIRRQYEKVLNRIITEYQNKNMMRAILP